MKKFYPGLLVGLLILVGCNSQGSKSPARAGGAAMAVPAMKVEQNQGQPAGAPGGAAAEGMPRKIKYNAEVQLVVENLDQSEQALRTLITQSKGYISQSETLGSSGSPRSSHWKIRVPVDHLEAFLEAVVKLGVPEKNSTDSEDVTEEYYDLETRLANKRHEAQRLQGYLDDKKLTSKLEEIFSIEQQVNRVQGEIDQLETRKRLLTNLTDLATVTLTLREVKDYVPPQAPAPPTFGERIAQTFFDSVDVLVTFGKNLTLVLVALAPWLPVLLLVVGLLWWLVQRARRYARGSIPTVEGPGEAAS